MTDRYGFEFAFLLLGTFRRIIDEVHAELALNGHPEARPAHGFALQAIGPEGITITELGRRLGVTKQAAAKTAKRLETLGYVQRESDPADARATRLRRSARGEEMLRLSAIAFERQKARWIAELGEDRFATLLADLERLGGGTSIGDFAGWLQDQP